MSLPARDPVAGFFDFGEKGGIAPAGSDAFAPFTGFTSGPGVRGASLPMVGDSASTYRKGNMWGFDQDNGAIVRQYVSAHKSIPALKEDTGPGHLVYSCSPRMKQYFMAKELGSARREEPQFQGVREPLEFKSLSRLNRWLRSKEGRATFGRDTDCLRFRQTYRFAGAQITKAHDSLGVNDEFVLALVTARRARIKDFTLIDGKGAQMNDVVFVVWRRFRYTGVPMPEAKAPLERKRRALDDDDDDSGDDERKEVTKDVIKKKLGILRPVKEPGIAADKDEEEYYWRGDIWYGPRGTQPNQALYMPDNGSFIGDIDFLGYVLDRYGDRSQAMVNQANAKEALHPSTDSDDWKKAFVALPDLEIHLKIR